MRHIMLIFPPPLSKNTAQMRLEKFLGDADSREIILSDCYYKGHEPTTVTIGPKEGDHLKIQVQDQSTGFSAVVRGWMWETESGVKTAGWYGWLGAILRAASESSEK